MSQTAATHAAPDAHDDHGEHATCTGIPNKKMFMWAFLASDCMFFGCLIATHLVYRISPPPGSPDLGPILDIEIVSISTFLLLMSSLMMALSVHAIGKNNLKSFRFYILMTVAMGLGFLGIQSYEWYYFVNEHGLTITSSLFGSTFYTLTGTHKIHVIIGIIWLMTYFFYSFSGKMNHKSELDVEVAGLYWHFVDIVWIVIFTVVFLLEFVDM